MSWFKRRPRLKEPLKTIPHRNSLTTERLLKETKLSTTPIIQPDPDKSSASKKGKNE
jgi:hypothetical protein